MHVTHTHTHTHVRTHTHRHTCKHTHAHTHTRTYMHTHMHTRTHTHTKLDRSFPTNAQSHQTTPISQLTLTHRCCSCRRATPPEVAKREEQCSPVWHGRGDGQVQGNCNSVTSTMPSHTTVSSPLTLCHDQLKQHLYKPRVDHCQ